MENNIASIKPEEIESTLSKLFEEEKKSNLIKASLFNLIIYIEDDRREPYFKELTKSLIKKFPCRIIFIKQSSKDKDLLETSVSSIKPNGADDGFFCEFIHFKISKNYQERIPFLITPHIAPNLPVYLLFGKDPSLDDTPTSLGLDLHVSRIIFDTECMEHMSLFATYIKSLHIEKINIGDLNWARFSSWRNLFTKFYQNKKKLKFLATAKEITINYNTHTTESFYHNKIQATYMQGWIANKLGWSFETILCHDNILSITYRSKYGHHKIELKGIEPLDILPPGRIVSIVVNNDDESTSFIRDKKTPHIIKICHCTHEICEIPILYPLTKEGSGNSITREIYYQDTNNDFLDVLDLISHWKTGIICS